MKLLFFFVIFIDFYYSYQEKNASATFYFPSICSSCNYTDEEAKLNYELYITITCPNCEKYPLTDVPLEINFTSPLINQDCGPISQNVYQKTYSCQVEFNCSAYNIDITAGKMHNKYISFITDNLTTINLSNKKYINTKETYPLQYINWRDKKVHYFYFIFNQLVTNNSETKVYIYNNTHKIIDLTEYCEIYEDFVVCLPEEKILGAEHNHPDRRFTYKIKYVDICGEYNPYVSVIILKSNFFNINNILLIFIILIIFI